MNDERTVLAAFALTPGIGVKAVENLRQHFGSLSEVLNVPPQDLLGVAGIGKVLAGRIAQIDPQQTAARMAHFQAQGVQITLFGDADYPSAFVPLKDKPLILFVIGTLTDSERSAHKTIAIIGTREPSEHSRRRAGAWASAFSQAGWTVISGLARGIDRAAHEGALKGGGRTIAVLGSGVKSIYPPEHSPLAEQISEQGALMCEVQPYAFPARENLVFRNRLIVGLSHAVIVIEAGSNSGALHAARRAHEYQIPVFAHFNSRGNQMILEQFAQRLPPSPHLLIDQLTR